MSFTSFIHSFELFVHFIAGKKTCSVSGLGKAERVPYINHSAVVKKLPKFAICSFLVRPASPRRQWAYVLPMLLSFLFKYRSCHSTTGGRIATRILASTSSMKIYYGYKFGELWSSNH